MGTPLPMPEYKKCDGSPYMSGTEWEFEDAMNAARAGNYPTVFAYRRTEEPTVKLRDPQRSEKEIQYQRVCDFF
jgi:hypothetical protein